MKKAKFKRWVPLYLMMAPGSDIWKVLVGVAIAYLSVYQ